MDALDNKCPACGAPITFNPQNQKWDCEYCGSKFTLEEMKKYNNASSDKENNNSHTNTNKLEDLDVYHCKNCGAEVMADEVTTATFCVYCGSTTILKNRITQGVAPSKIIPFKKVKEEAVKTFQKLRKGRPLMPKLFNDPKNIEKITGVYIPFWAYDLRISGDISFNATDEESWSDYNYHYIKTNRYLSKRNGYMEFDRILVDGSSHFDDDLMDSLEPFNFEDLVDYNHAYLSGFLAEKYDVDSNTAITRAENRATNSAIEVVKETVYHQTKTLSTHSMEITKLKDYYILLPVWMVNVIYKNKTYTFAMNGQTGEIVGNIPLDITKTIIMTLIIFVTVAVIVSLCVLLGGQ